MKIAVPRTILVLLAALFSAYHLVLAAYAWEAPRSFVPVGAAMLLYAVATVASLWPTRSARMPLWMAVTSVIVVLLMTLLVSSQLDAGTLRESSYATWYVAATGTLMVIVSTRRRHLWAWIGVALVAVHTALWLGPGALPVVGVVGNAAWVGISHLARRSFDAAERAARTYAAAERQAAEWQAAQEARLHERQSRLRQTGRRALPVLERVVAADGELSVEERQECLLLEGAIRDEIRGRLLLDDAVRAEVTAARRAGSKVTLLDEGGLDDLSPEELDRVRREIAAALHGTRSARLVIRTVPDGEGVVATIVGVSDGPAGEENVDLWLEVTVAAREFER